MPQKWECVVFIHLDTPLSGVLNEVEMVEVLDSAESDYSVVYLRKGNQPSDAEVRLEVWFRDGYPALPFQRVSDGDSIAVEHQRVIFFRFPEGSPIPRFYEFPVDPRRIEQVAGRPEDDRIVEGA